MNYVGQLRIYSLVDFILFAYVFSNNRTELIGAVLLWVGFLSYLEWRHKDEGRYAIHPIVWLLLFGLGIFFLQSLFAALFVLLCIIYSEKKRGYLGTISPIFRGLQMIAIALALQPLFSIQVAVSGLVIMIRNLLGDFRDIVKDKKRNIHTAPVIFGFKKNVKYIHLVGVLGTSLLWWSWSDLPIWILFSVWCIELATYSLTPR